MGREGYPHLLLMLLWLRLCWHRIWEVGLAQIFTDNKLKPQNGRDFSFGKQKRRLSPALWIKVVLGEEEEVAAAAAAACAIAPHLSQPLGTQSGALVPSPAPVGPVLFLCPLDRVVGL